VKVEKVAKSRQMVQNSQPLSPSCLQGIRSSSKVTGEMKSVDTQLRLLLSRGSIAITLAKIATRRVLNDVNNFLKKTWLSMMTRAGSTLWAITSDV